MPDEPGGSAEVNVDVVPIQGCTPFVKELLDGQDAVDVLCQAVAGSDPLGEVVVSNIDASAWHRVWSQIAGAAPRLLVRRADPVMPVGAVASGDWADPSNPLVIVRTFLADQFKEDAAQRDQLTAAFEQLVATEDASDAEVPA